MLHDAGPVREPKIECRVHGAAFETYICEHLAANPSQTWYSSAPTEQDQWPDAWCSTCHQAYLTQGEWNDKNEGVLKVRLFCDRCYNQHRALGAWIEVPG